MNEIVAVVDGTVPVMMVGVVDCNRRHTIPHMISKVPTESESTFCTSNASTTFYLFLELLKQQK
jgi:hypothetical protein